MRRLVLIAMALVGGGIARPAISLADCGPLLACGDINGDVLADLADYADLFGCLGQAPEFAPACSCADLDGSGLIDLRDFALFAPLFEKTSDEVPPNCTGAVGTLADLTAYRPQHGSGYAPFPRTAVSEAAEDSPTLGPGIRINGPGDSDPSGEDDLIEVELVIDQPGAELALRRSQDSLEIWTTRDKQPGTQIAFAADRTDALPIGPADMSITLWVEWTSLFHGLAELQVEPLGSSLVKDVLVFHSFEGIVLALGGEDQVPSIPVDSNHGTFLVGVVLYGQGYDVHMFDEDIVAADGSGVAYDAAADAIQNRLVEEVAIFGYSHGGGSTYDLADRLDLFRASLGIFTITYTSYVDSVSNNSDLDVGMELRRPPSTAYHLNHYQHGSFFQDLGLDGGPVTNSNPPPSGLDVETTAWGASSTHFEVDDFIQVRDMLETTLIPQVTR